MAKHTEGPWRLHDMETATVVEVRRRLTIACADSKSHSEEENIANAHLISAAPEMLDALKRSEHLLGAIQKFIEDNNLHEYESFWDEAVCDGFCMINDAKIAQDDALDAIAKAEGK